MFDINRTQINAFLKLIDYISDFISNFVPYLKFRCIWLTGDTNKEQP